MASGRSTRERGRAVESQVAAHLEAHGLGILARNVELAGAEIDLIARDIEDGQPIVVFVEVRSRRVDEHGRPVETVGPTKQRRLIRAATAWLVRAGLWEKIAVRFDVIGVTAPEGRAHLEWIRRAFEVDG